MVGLSRTLEGLLTGHDETKAFLMGYTIIRDISRIKQKMRDMSRILVRMPSFYVHRSVATGKG